MSNSDKPYGNVDILIVEDSPTQAVKLQFLLEKNGYGVTIARNGVEALSCLRLGRPGLVVSDIVMPEMDGYELCRRIRADEELRYIPVLLLTTLSEPEDIVRGLESGADNFLTKPYDETILLSRIQYILINKEIRRNPQSDMGIEIFFAGNRHFINSDRIQILDLLFSTYENALQQKRELEKVNKKLTDALETIKTLHGFLPICANCKKIRDDDGQWQDLESFISEHSEAKVSHGICPECKKNLYPELSRDQGL